MCESAEKFEISFFSFGFLEIFHVVTLVNVTSGLVDSQTLFDTLYLLIRFGLNQKASSQDKTTVNPEEETKCKVFMYVSPLCLYFTDKEEQLSEC